MSAPALPDLSRVTNRQLLMAAAGLSVVSTVLAAVVFLAGGDDEAVESLDRAMVRLGDVDDSLVGADLELLARLLVDEGRTVHGVDLASRRQRHGAGNAGSGSLRVINDLASGRIEGLVVVGLHTDSNLAAGHAISVSEKKKWSSSEEAVIESRRAVGSTEKVSTTWSQPRAGRVDMT